MFHRNYRAFLCTSLVSALQISLNSQHYTLFLRAKTYKKLLEFIMSEILLILVLRKENKQNSDMTWQRYKLNLRNSLLLEEYFRVMEQKVSELSFVSRCIVLFLVTEKSCHCATVR